MKRDKYDFMEEVINLLDRALSDLDTEDFNYFINSILEQIKAYE